MNAVELWVNGNYVLRCILPHFPPAKLTTYNLKRIVCYVKSKNMPIVDGSIVKLSVGMWKHIACQKLGFSAEICEMYFDVYWQYENENDGKSQSSTKEVSLVPFTMFLFMQLVNRKNIRDLIDDSERYPFPAALQSTDPSSRGREENIEIIALKFVQRNLRDILEIIALAGNEVQDYKNPEVSCYSCMVTGLKCLDDIFEGREIDKIKNVVSFLSLCKLRFDLSKDLNLKSVEKWIRCSLGSDPYAVASSSYQNTSVSSGNILVKPSFNVDAKAIMHNSHSAPPNRKCVIVNGVIRQTVIKDNDIVFGSHTHVTNCRNAFLYLTTFMRCVVIRKCRNISVVTKKIGETLRIENCSDIRITAKARRVIISNCQRCMFSISTDSHPLIFGTCNENLVFGPYNLARNSDEKLITIDNSADFWDQPLCFQSESTPRSANHCIWSLVNPKDFKLLCLPFRASHDRTIVSSKLSKAEMKLPISYQKELAIRCEKVKSWTKIMKNLSAAQCTTLQNFMQEKFTMWLKDSKRVEELLQLKRLESRKSKRS